MVVRTGDDGNSDVAGMRPALAVALVTRHWARQPWRSRGGSGGGGSNVERITFKWAQAGSRVFKRLQELPNFQTVSSGLAAGVFLVMKTAEEGDEDGNGKTHGVQSSEMRGASSRTTDYAMKNATRTGMTSYKALFKVCRTPQDSFPVHNIEVSRSSQLMARISDRSALLAAAMGVFTPLTDPQTWSEGKK
ncbi:uncharacterized protein SCHCODRAFT_02597182 [Schizophyllum commune H4-8]|uniref:uncharacterized protein n=1 Tax=Schizophyllum commune (strain H4-8 / FGSC 9210) TaxID=578458 RepID=UPI00215F8293|nr:uncharacterized protein SCHCODRAFT_02597182 [Schizophyllum commune H4-8]KAI5898907.1 hypothetical protein SCHCODRAFT_02597182 [Schizophyllum commune H4-8]